MKKIENKNLFLDKIKPVLRKSKFSTINMDDMARHMDISKVTLYKYFSSKDEIIEMLVDHCIEFLQNADVQLQDEELSWGKRFHMLYIQSLQCVLYMPDILLEDLKSVYPVLYDRLSTAELERHRNLRRFYEAGVEKSVFHPVNSTLSVVQDDLMLRQMVEPSFAVRHDFSLKQALFEFYKMKKYQLFVPNMLDSVDDAEMEELLLQTIQKISY